jgi:hypothetical protein
MLRLDNATVGRRLDVGLDQPLVRQTRHALLHLADGLDVEINCLLHRHVLGVDVDTAVAVVAVGPKRGQ